MLVYANLSEHKVNASQIHKKVVKYQEKNIWLLIFAVQISALNQVIYFICNICAQCNRQSTSCRMLYLRHMCDISDLVIVALCDSLLTVVSLRPRATWLCTYTGLVLTCYLGGYWQMWEIMVLMDCFSCVNCHTQSSEIIGILLDDTLVAYIIL